MKSVCNVSITLSLRKHCERVNVFANFELDCATNATSGKFYGTRYSPYFAIATRMVFKTDRKSFMQLAPDLDLAEKSSTKFRIPGHL